MLRAPNGSLSGTSVQTARFSTQRSLFSTQGGMPMSTPSQTANDSPDDRISPTRRRNVRIGFAALTAALAATGFWVGDVATGLLGVGLTVSNGLGAWGAQRDADGRDGRRFHTAHRVVLWTAFALWIGWLVLPMLG